MRRTIIDSTDGLINKITRLIMRDNPSELVFVKVENRILRRLVVKCVRLTEHDRYELVKYGEPLKERLD